MCLKVVVLLTFCAACFPFALLLVLRALFGRLPSASLLFLRFGGILADLVARTNFHKAAVRSGSVARTRLKTAGGGVD